MDGFFVALIAGLAFIGGIFVGASALDHGWVKDCELVGAHQSSGIAYTCAPKP